MTAPSIKVQTTFDMVRVLFGDTIHLMFARSKFIGLQSWMYGNRNYFIEITLDGGTIQTEYDDVEKWKSILKELGNIL
jgi:hypothetical protein